MGAFNNILDRYMTMRATTSRDYKQTMPNGQSLKMLAKDYILQFPLLISQNISVDAATALADGFEVENTIMLRLLLQNDFGKLTNGTGDLLSALKLVHTNIEGGPNSQIMRTPALFEESINSALQSSLIPVEDKFCKWSLNETTLPKYLKEAKDDTPNGTIVNKTDNSWESTNDIGPFSYSVKQTTSSSSTATFSDKNVFDPDMFKKVNDLQPTFLKVRISVANSVQNSVSAGIGIPIPGTDGKSIFNIGSRNEKNPSYGMSRSSLDEKEVIFGVKCVAHPIKSEDIIFNIGNSYKNTGFFRFIKWTTGEYNFAKGLFEFLFDFTNMKNTGIQAAKSSNYWWFKLKKLRAMNKATRLSNHSLDAPIKVATLMVSKDEVDYIANTYKVDLTLPKFAQNLLDQLYLLNFGYIDESTNTVYIYDEPSGHYIVKKLEAFKRQKKPKPLNLDDLKSLFGR